MYELFNNILALLVTGLILVILFHKKMMRSPIWHATVTPLASIIGSGFLISAPVLFLSAGAWASWVMLAIVLAGYALGYCLRFNIQFIEPLLKKITYESRPFHLIENASRFFLGVAYVISVAFYLKLLSAFTLRGAGLTNSVIENSLTTLILLIIGINGKLRGLRALELLEVYSVNIKLAIIGGLLLCYFSFNLHLLFYHQWIIKVQAHEDFLTSLRQVFGILIIVQGFETSRYLGYAYDAKMRIRTMRYAQWIAGFVYVSFITLSMIAFHDVQTIHETLIIDISRTVAPILFYLLIVAAVASQFSAAVADTVGGGGLLIAVFKRKLSAPNAYLIIIVVSIMLTWATNIYEIITLASKAFAIFYGLQVLLTCLYSIQHPKKAILPMIVSIFAFILMLLVVVFGIPVD